MLTSVAVILPLGTLVAHRLTAMRSSNFSVGSGGSGWNSKPTAVHSSITSSNPRSRLVTRIEANAYDDLELDEHSQGAGKGAGVRVYRDVDQTVEHSPRQFN